jgi:hypothetical protein
MKKAAICFLAIILALPLYAAVKTKTAPKRVVSKTATKKVVSKVKAGKIKAVARPSTREAVAAPGFKDLKPADPAFSYVMRMVVSYEAIAGYPDGTFRGSKTITRAEFSKIMTNALAYLEKKYSVPLAEEPASPEVSFKDLPATHWARPYVSRLVARYKIISGYPDGTFKPNKTISRFELATVLAKTVKLISARYNLMTLPAPSQEVVLQDVKAKHWAQQDVQLLLALKIMAPATKQVKQKQQVFFNGAAAVNRYNVAFSVDRLLSLSGAALAVQPPAPPAPPPAASRVERSLQIASRPQAFVSSGWGNVYETASSTNNWLGYGADATYGDTFKVWTLSGNYELTGKYGYNQIVYDVPSGGAVKAVVANENRFELQLNTIYPVVELWGINGKLLTGLKYVNLSNSAAPTNFTGFNAGLATSTKLYGRNLLLRGFWSLPLLRAQASASVLGQPSQLFDYEASVDAEILNWPVLLGLAGETMTFSGTGLRCYNMAFVRYFIM